jgi:hypothetical protein
MYVCGRISEQSFEGVEALAMLLDTLATLGALVLAVPITMRSMKIRNPMWISTAVVLLLIAVLDPYPIVVVRALIG